jgi:hypothetical protein
VGDGKSRALALQYPALIMRRIASRVAWKPPCDSYSSQIKLGDVFFFCRGQLLEEAVLDTGSFEITSSRVVFFLGQAALEPGVTDKSPQGVTGS